MYFYIFKHDVLSPLLTAISALLCLAETVQPLAPQC